MRTTGYARPFHPCDGRCAPSSVLVKTQEKQRQNFCYHLGDGHKELTAPIGLVKDFNSGRSACGADWEILPASESVVRPGEIARERQLFTGHQLLLTSLMLMLKGRSSRVG